MTLSRIFKTIFLIEFVKGLVIALKEMFRKSKTMSECRQIRQRIKKDGTNN